MNGTVAMALRRGALAGLLIAIIATAGLGQGATLRGRVLTDSTERPIAGVVVAIDELKIQAASDSLGNFLMTGIRPGAYIVTAKRIGFGALATRVRFNANAALDADFLMTPNVQALPDVKVETKPVPRGKLVEFEQRRVEGLGHFLTQADLEKHAFATFTDALRQLPGMEFYRDPNHYSEMYAVAGRLQAAACALCGGPKANGTLPPCYAAVVLDGAFVFGAGGPDEEKFNLNSVNPTTLAGVEYYASPASIPVKYNGTRSTCGLLVLWTK